MKTKTIAFAGILAAAFAAASLLSSKNGGTARAEAAGEKLFSGMLDQVNEAGSLKMSRAGQSLTLVTLDEGGWGLKEKGGYPVDFSKVTKNLLGLANMETVAAKTSNPERYSDIGLEGPDAENSPSVLVEAATQGGETLAALVVGETKVGRGGKEQMYVKKPDDAQTWLVRGNLDLEIDPLQWLQKDLAKIERKRIRAVRISHPDGEELFLSKNRTDETEFAVRDIPEGRELSYSSIGNSIGGALEYLKLEDVITANGIAESWPAPEAITTTEFWSFDGLHVTVLSAEVGTEDGPEVWSRIQAEYTASLPPGLGELDTSEIEVPEGAEPPAPVDEPELKDAEAVQAEAEELNEQFGNWAYRLPEFTNGNLRKRVADLLKALPPPPSPEGDEGSGAGNGLPMDGSDPLEGMNLEDLLSPEQLEDLKKQGIDVDNLKSSNASDG